MNELPPRFMSKVKKSTNGCWHWTAHIDEWGYGHFGFVRDGRNTSTSAHRYAYEHVNGSLPRRGEPGHMQVDHECHNRSKSCQGGPTCMHRRCVNPAHLTAKTPRDNGSSSRHSTASVNRAKTHCARAGHELTGENLGQRAGKRYCRTCHASNGIEARRKRKAAERPEGWARRYWQDEKTHCPEGHPYSGDNLYVTKAGARQCLACRRERSRRFMSEKRRVEREGVH